MLLSTDKNYYYKLYNTFPLLCSLYIPWVFLVVPILVPSFFGATLLLFGWCVWRKWRCDVMICTCTWDALIKLFFHVFPHNHLPIHHKTVSSSPYIVDFVVAAIIIIAIMIITYFPSSCLFDLLARPDRTKKYKRTVKKREQQNDCFSSYYPGYYGGNDEMHEDDDGMMMAYLFELNTFHKFSQILLYYLELIIFFLHIP